MPYRLTVENDFRIRCQIIVAVLVAIAATVVGILGGTHFMEPGSLALGFWAATWSEVNL